MRLAKNEWTREVDARSRTFLYQRLSLAVSGNDASFKDTMAFQDELKFK